MTSVEVAIPWRDSGCENRRRAWEWIQASWAVRHPDWRLVVRDAPGEWSIPAALNAALAATTADVVVVSSADCQVGADSLRSAVEMATRHPWVMATDVLLRLNQEVTEKALKQPPHASLPQNGIRRANQLGWGVLVLRREVVEAVTYDEKLDVAWEDSAFGYAAATLFGDPYRVQRVASRLLWHPRVRRYRLPGYVEAEERMRRYLVAYQATDQGAVRRLMAEGRGG